MSKKMRVTMLITMLIALFSLTSCGKDGSDGSDGQPGKVYLEYRWDDNVWGFDDNNSYTPYTVTEYEDYECSPYAATYDYTVYYTSIYYPYDDYYYTGTYYLPDANPGEPGEPGEEGGFFTDGDDGADGADGQDQYFYVYFDGYKKDGKQTVNVDKINRLSLQKNPNSELKADDKAKDASVK